MSFELQQNIKHNAQDLREYITGLHDWEQEMEIKEKAKAKLREQEQPHIRAEIQERRKNQEEQMRKNDEERRKKIVEKKNNLSRDSNTVQDYYKSWDQYDIDEELKILEEEEKRAYRPYNPYEDSKNYQRAKPKAKMVVKGNRNVGNVVKDPTSLKDKANLHFKVCEYQRAIDTYTQCLEKIEEGQDEENREQNRKLKAIVYSNRAMAYIKINERAKALTDCNESIKNDDKYMKTYLRRADCLKKIGKYKESLADYQMVKMLAPNQREADLQIKIITDFLKKRASQTQKNMIVAAPNIISGAYRLQIEEVDNLEEEQKEGELNYLEEL